MRSPPHRHRQALVRHAIFTIALLTYLFDPVDVVWRTVQHTAHPRVYEHLAFTTAALLLAAALALATRSTRQQHQAAANFLYITSVAFLLPWEGALLLVFGEGLRTGLTTSNPPRGRGLVYLCALLSMVLFSVTLQDRLADILFGAIFALALALDVLPARWFAR